MLVQIQPMRFIYLQHWQLHRLFSMHHHFTKSHGKRVASSSLTKWIYVAGYYTALKVYITISKRIIYQNSCQFKSTTTTARPVAAYNCNHTITCPTCYLTVFLIHSSVSHPHTQILTWCNSFSEYYGPWSNRSRSGSISHQIYTAGETSK